MFISKFVTAVCTVLFFIPMWVTAQKTILKGPIRTSPTDLVEGNNLSFEVTLENVNTSEIIVGGIDGQQLISKPISDILKKDPQTFFFNWRATPGEHRVFFRIKEPHTPIHSKQPATKITSTRNTKSHTVQLVFQVLPMGSTPDAQKTSDTYTPPVCKDPPVPDLTVIVNDNVSGSGYVGDPVSVRVTVFNLGQCASAPCKLKLLVNTTDQGTPIGEIMVPQLEPQSDTGNADTYSFTHYFEYVVQREANYQFRAVVDPENRIYEFRENNNDDYGGEFQSKIR